jgi:transcriptional regulator with XRE-family HTH domain
MGTVRKSPASPELKIFSDRFKKAIGFKKIDIAVLAKDSEYKPSYIQRLLTGKREPGMKKLILLANSLGCSVDYLLGLTTEARRATVVVEADTDAIKPRSSEHGQTSGQISGKAERLAAMIPELRDYNIELLTHIAEFIIEKRKQDLERLVEAITEEPKKDIEKGKVGFDGRVPDSGEDDFEDDFDDDDFEDDDFDDDDDEFDDCG